MHVSGGEDMWVEGTEWVGPAERHSPGWLEKGWSQSLGPGNVGSMAGRCDNPGEATGPCSWVVEITGVSECGRMWPGKDESKQTVGGGILGEDCHCSNCQVWHAASWSLTDNLATN